MSGGGSRKETGRFSDVALRIGGWSREQGIQAASRSEKTKRLDSLLERESLLPAPLVLSLEVSEADFGLQTQKGKMITFWCLSKPPSSQQSVIAAKETNTASSLPSLHHANQNEAETLTP